MPSYRIRQLKLPLDHDERDIGLAILRKLRIDERDLVRWELDRRSYDARDRANVRVIYSVTVELRRALRSNAGYGGIEAAQAKQPYAVPARTRPLRDRPIVVGSGPAGYFCALVLAEAGLAPIVLERGERVEGRSAKVAAFFETGRLDPESNIQFGEGGAGTYSDGKLTTSVADEGSRGAKVIEELIEAGAPEEIRYSGKPHVGTDYLVAVVKNLRAKIERLGGTVRFSSRVTSMLVENGRAAGVVVNDDEELRSPFVALAVGHSARDTFEELARLGARMERKAFAVGLRIEHLQETISRNQYGSSYGHPRLPVADYKLATRAADGRGVYSFCMCPGGYVVNASSERGMVACNGMSDFARDSRNANAAVVVSVGPEDFGPGGALAGVEFQRRWERAAFEAGGADMSLPVQTVGDFLASRPSTSLASLAPSIRGRYALSSLEDCLPEYAISAIKRALPEFDRRIGGFGAPEALLTGVETRTSSPVRILRDAGLSSSIRGLFPCGEGAGYAGGIMSAAMDGVRVAEAIARFDD